jgi:glycosyltransferase involved in cell wall biosynthesis
VGWHLAREVAKYHEVWVLTRPDESRSAIEAELAANPIPNLHFVYFTLPFWQDSLRWGQSGAMQIHYYLWQIQAYFVARRLHREIGFDVCHHVTFVKYSSPSFISFLPLPFVWGPVGGGESAPAPFWRDFSLRAKAYEWARTVVRWLGERDPFVGATARRSAVIRATTEDTAKRLRQMGGHQVEIGSAIGLSAGEIEQLAHYPPPDQTPIRLISVGRLLHWKGFHLGLRAFAEADLSDAEYWVVGDGPERQPLQALAAQLGIASRVKFWGVLSRTETLQRLGRSHILVHPSLHDSGGWVCIEAMATGRPVICLDLGGPGAQITAETGCKVPACDPAQAVQDLALAMKQLARDSELRSRLGKAGQQHVQQHYTWEAMGRSMSQLYQSLATNCSQSPTLSKVP